MPQFIHLSTERNLDVFQILAITNKAAINIIVKVFVWTHFQLHGWYEIYT